MRNEWRNPMTKCVMDDYLGAYVLDALDSDEQTAVDAHLQDCAWCAEEVASLACTASRLVLLSVQDAEQALSMDAAPAVSATPAPRRRPRRAALLAAGAAALVMASGTGMDLLSGGPAPPAHTTTLQAEGQGTRVSALLTVAPRSAATALHLSIRGAYPNGTCYLIVHGRDGRSATVARWVATARGRAEVAATTSIPPHDLGTFDVVTQYGRRLVRFVMPTHHN